MAELVADSGPLIALTRLDLLWLPARLEHEVLVTESVWAEVTRAPRAGEWALLHGALEAGWLTMVPGPQALDAALVGVQLDDGELSALDLALQRGAAILLDELRGRTVAKQLGLTVVGTLGLLLVARERGQVSALRPMIDMLQRTGYFLSSRLIRQVLVNAGE